MICAKENPESLWGNKWPPRTEVRNEWLGDCDEGDLGYERNQLPEILGLFIGTYFEDFADTVVVSPLLEKLLLVCGGVSFYEILELGEVSGEEETATHGQARPHKAPLSYVVPQNISQLKSVSYDGAGESAFPVSFVSS